MELRRGRRVSFQDIALIEFDDLCLSLKEEKGADPIAVQDDLRRIVAYLCWRKRTVKSASILLLRSFMVTSRKKSRALPSCGSAPPMNCCGSPAWT